MLSEAQQFWDAIKGKVRQLIRSETENTYRCERYEVTTAPNGTKVGVTLPAGNTEIFLPYSAEVAGAAVGDPVMAVWWRSMSNAKVCWYADGYRGTNAMTLLCTAGPLSSTATSYNFSEAWTNYNILVFNVCFYSNVEATVVWDKASFNNSSGSARVHATTRVGTGGELFTVQCYKNGNNAIYAQMVSGSQSNIYINVYGIR